MRHQGVVATEESCPLLKRGLWIIEHGLVLLGKIFDPLGLPSYDYFPVTSLAFLQVTIVFSALLFTIFFVRLHVGLLWLNVLTEPTGGELGGEQSLEVSQMIK